MSKKVKEDTTSGAEEVILAAGDPSLSAEQRVALRQQRIQDYESAAIRAPDPLRAVMGASNANLLWTSLQLEQVIAELLALSPHRAEGLAKSMPALDLHLRLHRQIERYAQFEQRARALELAQHQHATMFGSGGEELEI